MAIWTLIGAASLGLATPPADVPPQIDDEATGTAQTEILDSITDRYRRMTIPVTIEGEGPYRFMIDTGSQATVVTRGLSEQLQLQPAGRATVVGMASSVSVDLVQLDGLEFAARVFDNISAPLLEKRHVGADGILGLDSLQDLRVLINFREDTIAVDQASELGGNRGYEIVVRARRKLGRLIITDAIIDGVRTAVIIDTGAQSSVGNIALQRRLRANTEQVDAATDVHGTIMTGSMDVVRSVRIQGMALQQLPMTFTDSPAFHALGLGKKPALILGMNSLRLFDRVAIDFASRKVLFDLPADL